jgi:hypothetical protein
MKHESSGFRLLHELPYFDRGSALPAQTNHGFRSLFRCTQRTPTLVRQTVQQVDLSRYQLIMPDQSMRLQTVVSWKDIVAEWGSSVVAGLARNGLSHAPRCKLAEPSHNL